MSCRHPDNRVRPSENGACSRLAGGRSRLWTEENVEESRILVVDDEPEILELLVDVLAQEGYAAQSTSDSLEAARLLEATAFDLVVSDIVMPHLDGLQLLDIAKRRNPDVEVVLMTGYATRELARDAREKGAAAFIEKPFRMDQLLAALRGALLRWRLKQDPSSLRADRRADR